MKNRNLKLFLSIIILNFSVFHFLHHQQITQLETVEKGAHFVGGFAGSYGISAALQQLRSLQPVIGIVKSATGQISVSAKLVNKQEYINNLIQARELSQYPDFQNFKMHFKRILGIDIFAMLPNTNSINNGFNPELVPAIAGIQQGCMNSAEQSLLAQIFLQSESDLVKNGANVLGDQVTSKALQALDATDIVTQNITTKIASNPVALNFIENAPPIDWDIFEKFIHSNFIVPGIEQFKDIRQLSKLFLKTNGFTDISMFTKAEIYYANKIHYTQPASNYAKSFIETVKPGLELINPETNEIIIYEIKGLAFNHVHSAEYGGKTPTGGHCMPEYLDNETFNPIFIKDGPHDTKYVRLNDPIKLGKFKDSSLYPLDWSHEKCDMKMFEALLGDSKKFIEKDKIKPNGFKIKCFTQEGMELRVHFDTETGIIGSHYPFIEIEKIEK